MSRPARKMSRRSAAISRLECALIFDALEPRALLSAGSSFDAIDGQPNLQPSFYANDPSASNEDAGQVTVSQWAEFYAGNDEESQTAIFTVLDTSDPSLFAVLPAVAPDGTLTYTSAPDLSGVATFAVFVTDSGGTEDGGVDTSVTFTFTITIRAVNDRPTFAAVTPPAVDEDSAPVSIPAWASFSPQGGADELLETPTFNVSAPSKASLFSVSPQVAPDGTLTYAPAPNANGVATFTVSVTDSGGTDFDGIDTSILQTFTITINSVNDQPAFVASEPPQVNEDPGSVSIAGWSTFSPGGGDDELVQSATYVVSGVTNSVLFANAPTIAPNGTLNYTPALNANGVATFVVSLTDSGGTIRGGVNAAPAQTFTITVNAVNDQPTFAAASPPASNEDAPQVVIANWASFNPRGGADEATQTGVYTISSPSNSALFSEVPMLGSDGTLSYTAAPDANGTATFTVFTTDSGDTARGGVNVSVVQTFTLTINAVNDQPSFTASNPPAVSEDAPPVSIANWATFSPGGGIDESGQGVSYTISGVSNVNLFASLPAVSPTGTLTYSLSPGIFGAVTFNVTAIDSGGSAHDGVDRSVAKTFSILVNPVNQAPTFVKGPDILILQNSGDFAQNHWATQISHGPPNEAAQVLTFELSNYDTTLFSAQPAIDPITGSLTFTPRFGAFGGTTITATLRDTGGTLNGGSDFSVQTFSIHMAVEFGTVQERKNIKVLATDADGTHGTFSLSGKGTGRLIARGGGVFDVTLSGADRKTTLKISPDNVGDGEFELRGISAPAAAGLGGAQFLGRIDAPTTNLSGAVTISGSIANINVGDVTHGGTWTIGLPQSGKDQVSISLGKVSDLSLNSSTAIKTLSAIDWTDAGGTADIITTPYINTIAIKGAKGNAALGNFEAGLTLSGQGAPKSISLVKFSAAGDITQGDWKITGGIGSITARATGAAWHVGTSAKAAGPIKSITTTGGVMSGVIQASALGAVKVKTDLVDAAWTLTQTFTSQRDSLGSLAVGGMIRSSAIRSIGNVGSVAAGAMVDSSLFVGTRASLSSLPTAPNDFNFIDATIGSFTIRGVPQAEPSEEGTPEPASFTRSQVAAGTLGKVAIRVVDPAGGGAPTGFAAGIIKSFSRGAFKLKNVEAPNANNDPEPGGDYVVRTV